MKRLFAFFAVLFLTVGLGAQMTSAPPPAPTPAPGTVNQPQTTGGTVGVPASAPLVTTPSMDLGGPLTPPVVRTAPTVVVVTPSPVSTPTVVTAPPAAESPASTESGAVATQPPMNLGAARGETSFTSSDTRSLGDIAAQYRKKEGVQNASRVYTNADIARLNREQARDLDMPMSDRDDTEDAQPEGKDKTTPVAPHNPR